MKYFLPFFSFCFLITQFSFASQFGTPPDCDTLVYTNGKKIPVKIQSVNADEIKYKECGNNDSLVYVISPEMISSIKYVKEGSIVIENIQNPKHNGKQYEVYSILSFVSSFFTLFLINGIGLLAVPAAITFGILGLNRIRKNKDTYKGKGFAIAGIVIAPALISAYIIFLVWALLH